MHNWLMRNLSLLAFLLILMYLLAIAIVYGLFLRFLALCDDIAAIRRQQTG